jgi:hypothetical protein
MPEWDEESIAAEQCVDFITDIAHRGGIDPATGATVQPTVAPSLADARNDVVSLLGVMISLAQQKWPSLRGRFRV